MTTTEKMAFRLFLKPGQATECRQRHEAAWPALTQWLKSCGIFDDSICLDEAHGVLLAILQRGAGRLMDTLLQHPVLRRWWAHVADILLSHADGSPMVEPLPCAFHLE